MFVRKPDSREWSLASEVPCYQQQPPGKWGCHRTCTPASSSAGTKETREQTNQHQLLIHWHLLKRIICPRALWDKVFVTQDVIYSLVTGITHLQQAPICWPDQVTQKRGDSEEESQGLRNLLKMQPAHPHLPAGDFTTLLWELVLKEGTMGVNNTKIISLTCLSHYHLRTLAGLSLRNTFFSQFKTQNWAACTSGDAFTCWSPAHHSLQDLSFNILSLKWRLTAWFLKSPWNLIL